MPPDDSEATASWNESRRLIISELRRVDDSLKGLETKIDQLNDKSRDRIGMVEAQVGAQLSDMKVRVAMLEVRAKIWGGMVGFFGGAVASGVVDILVGKIAK